MHILILFIKATESLNFWLSQWKITGSTYKMAIIIFTIKQYIISMVSDRMQRAILCPNGSPGHTGGAGTSPEHFNCWSSWEWVILGLGFVFLGFFKFKISKYINNFSRKHKIWEKIVELVISQFFALGDILFWTFQMLYIIKEKLAVQNGISSPPSSMETCNF